MISHVEPMPQSEKDVKHLVNVLRDFLPDKEKFYPLHEPIFQGNEWLYVKECLDEGWVSSVGKFVDRFENDLAAFCGVKHVVAVMNGTSALHAALIVAGVKAQDHVLVPALTFVATANAVAYIGATPHFIDASEETLGICPYKLRAYLEKTAEVRDGACFDRRSGQKIAAIIPMHSYGHPCEMDELIDICQHFSIPIVEDAAESLGSTYKGRHTGGFGLCGITSFNGNKIMTSGGGGAILTNDDDFAQKAKHLTTTGKKPHSWNFYHDITAYNYRLPNINAALGCAQLEKVPSYLEKKRALAMEYKKALSDIDGVTFFEAPKNCNSNYWLNTILLDPALTESRDSILELTNKIGIMTRPAWALMPHLPMYADCPRMDLTVAEQLEKRIINIPSSVSLADR
jgi:perosamine synthetase